MKYISYLSGDFIDLGVEELSSLLRIKNLNPIDRLLILEPDKTLEKNFERLALTKNIYELLFECKTNELIRIMKSFDWGAVYKVNFCLRINHLNGLRPLNKENKNQKLSESNLAGYVWRSVKSPKVDLKNPETLIELFLIKDKVYCGRLVWQNRGNFEARKSHLRPFSNPSSLHPKIAKALVNILGIEKNKAVFDPFCGTGGFLIEAGLMGITIQGCDISKEMVDGCIENLKYFKIKNYKIFNRNALDFKNKVDYVITDLPYGLNSNIYLEFNKRTLNEKSNKINLKANRKNQIKNIEGFYLRFLKNLRKMLQRKAIIIFPSYVNYKKILKASNFKIEKEFGIYVHRSLTRKIVLIR